MQGAVDVQVSSEKNKKKQSGALLFTGNDFAHTYQAIISNCAESWNYRNPPFLNSPTTFLLAKPKQVIVITAGKRIVFRSHLCLLSHIIICILSLGSLPCSLFIVSHLLFTPPHPPLSPQCFLSPLRQCAPLI